MFCFNMIMRWFITINNHKYCIFNRMYQFYCVSYSLIRFWLKIPKMNGNYISRLLLLCYYLYVLYAIKRTTLAYMIMVVVRHIYVKVRNQCITIKKMFDYDLHLFIIRNFTLSFLQYLSMLAKLVEITPYRIWTFFSLNIK